MTVLKAFNIRRHSGGPSSRLIQTFLREGVFYYILISIANLVSYTSGLNTHWKYDEYLFFSLL